MKYGIYLPNFGAFGHADVMAQLAKEAEDAGWDGFFIWDHVARPITDNLVDPWIALTAVAMATKTIVFGPMVTPLPRRRPQILARETVSLDRLSQGRLILGVGLGSGRPQEWWAFGDETDLKTRAHMTDEALQVLTGLWSGDPFSYQGKHYIVEEAHFLPKPYQQPRIPIWIAGYYPHKPPMRRAAQWDGMFILFGEADDKISALRETLAYIQEQRQTDASFDAVYLNKLPADTPQVELAEIASRASDAGATWWLNTISPDCYDFNWDETWDLDAMRQTILQGPPK